MTIITDSDKILEVRPTDEFLDNKVIDENYEGWEESDDEPIR